LDSLNCSNGAQKFCFTARFRKTRYYAGPKDWPLLRNQDLYLGLAVLALFAIGVYLFFKETARSRWRKHRRRRF
jgi:hypothetical protein